MLTPPHKCQHALTTMGQTGDSDAGVAMSLPPPVAGRGQNPALPCTMPQFPPKTQGHSPSPPTRADFPPMCKRGLPGAGGFFQGKQVPLKNPIPEPPRWEAASGTIPLPSLGNRHPSPLRLSSSGRDLPQSRGGRRQARPGKQERQARPEIPIARGGGADCAPEEFTQDGTN